MYSTIVLLLTMIIYERLQNGTPYLYVGGRLQGVSPSFDKGILQTSPPTVPP